MWWGEIYLALTLVTVIVARLSPSMVARDCSVLLICWVAAISQIYIPNVVEDVSRSILAGIAFCIASYLATLYRGSSLPTIVATGFFCMVMWSLAASYVDISPYAYKAGHNGIYVLQVIATLITASWQWRKLRRYA